MNRPIKFRGKFKKDGEWEYGGVRFGDMGQAYILPHGATHRVELVNRSSVGQFTGLSDKNGKEIYEGDIVRFATDKPAEVWFKDCCFGIKRGDIVRRLKVFNGVNEWEVIGNIYENPELI